LEGAAGECPQEYSTLAAQARKPAPGNRQATLANLVARGANLLNRNTERICF
jgi:hypothetical protein